MLCAPPRPIWWRLPQGPASGLMSGLCQQVSPHLSLLQSSTNRAYIPICSLELIYCCSGKSLCPGFACAQANKQRKPTPTFMREMKAACFLFRALWIRCVGWAIVAQWLTVGGCVRCFELAFTLGWGTCKTAFACSVLPLCVAVTYCNQFDLLSNAAGAIGGTAGQGPSPWLPAWLELGLQPSRAHRSDACKPLSRA